MPCHLGKSCGCHVRNRKTCKNWMPGRGSKYYRCGRFLATRVTCDLPTTACATCPHFVASLGRPEPTIDWTDPQAVREHKREYMRQYRQKKS